MSRTLGLQISKPIVEVSTNTLLGTPSRICGLPNRDICVVDSQNHCLWVLDRSGKMKYRIGTGAKGHKDGHLRDAEFNLPQSAAVFHHSLFIADSGNNLIREVNLANAAVTTLPKSPPAPIDIYEFQEKLFILSSTNSAIFSYDPFRTQMGIAIADACKQPSGLTTNGEKLFFTDLATNSVKSWDGKIVETLYTSDSSKNLNKPMSLSYSGNNLYIADTYNHQIKVLSLITRTLSPLIGTGKAGNNCGTFANTQFSHPTNIFISGMSLFICDRGNNEVKVAELPLSKVQPFHVRR